MKTLLLFSLLLHFQSLFADDLVINLGSYHAAYRSELRSIGALNESNLGIGWQNNRWSAGIYNNSMNRASIYSARKFTRGRYFAFAGAVTGYHVDYPVLPFVGAGVNIGNLQLIAFPGAVEVNDNLNPLIIIGLSVRISI